MTIFKRDEFFRSWDPNPKWEPMPWDGTGSKVQEQEKGFNERSIKPLVWSKVDWKNFPQEGVFGYPRDFFVRFDVSHVTSFDGEDLMLIDRTWFGFPDPPRWGLLSRPAGEQTANWTAWGSFPDLPLAWHVPDTR